MKILLIGGGTGGHITPLLAVARELKNLLPETELVAVLEKKSKFTHLYLDEPLIDKVYQVRAGKFRRYAGESWLTRLFDIKTLLLNIRDVFRTLGGYIEAKRLLNELDPDILLIKGGFVAVPMGLAAARLGIPFITHDSDSLPGMANRIISRWAHTHATGMPAELYSYPQEKTVYTGIPVADKFHKVAPKDRTAYREKLGLTSAERVVTVVGGSLGAGQLNTDFSSIVARLMQKHPGLGIIHVTGSAHESITNNFYDGELTREERKLVKVLGFSSDIDAIHGAADVVVTRAGATQMAELSIQGLPVVIVPGALAGGHQDHNAQYYAQKQAAEVVAHADVEGLYRTLDKLLGDAARRKEISKNLQKLGKPESAKELARLVVEVNWKG